jgi:hypothetical protein
MGYGLWVWGLGFGVWRLAFGVWRLAKKKIIIRPKSFKLEHPNSRPKTQDPRLLKDETKILKK